MSLSRRSALGEGTVQNGWLAEIAWLLWVASAFLVLDSDLSFPSLLLVDIGNGTSEVQAVDGLQGSRQVLSL
jgi:hypothetical protein